MFQVKKEMACNTHIVQLVADDLSIAPVVVPVGYGVLQRPKETVENLHSTHHITLVTYIHYILYYSAVFLK